jgi:hypothetical protein
VSVNVYDEPEDAKTYSGTRPRGKKDGDPKKDWMRTLLARHQIFIQPSVIFNRTGFKKADLGTGHAVNLLEQHIDWRLQGQSSYIACSLLSLL